MEKTTALEEIHSPNVQTAIRCAKATILLSSLKHSLNSSQNSLIQSKEEDEELKLVKRELLREKDKNKKMKASSEIDLFTQILLMLLIWTLCLLIADEF